jgi:hypothetical protein
MAPGQQSKMLEMGAPLSSVQEINTRDFKLVAVPDSPLKPVIYIFLSTIVE